MREPARRKSAGTTRRTVLRSAGAAAVGALAGAAGPARAAVETPAALGGKPAVTFDARQHADASRWPRFGPDEEAAVLEVVRKPGYTAIKALEKEWRDYFGVPHAKAHCHGTTAIASMFFALDLPPGSEVLVPSYTFFATIMPMRLFGLVPVFVDVNPRTLNFDVDDARRRLTGKTKALFPVHWFGLPCEMRDLEAFAREHGLVLLEDAAHAHGAMYQGRYMGGFGRMSIFSYQTSKPLPGLEGGMGVYQRRDDFERAASFGNNDVQNEFPRDSPYRKYAGTSLGLKLRMNPMAAALVRAQLPRLAERNAAGAAQVRRLNDRLVQLPGLFEPPVPAEAKRLYYSTNMLFLDEAKAGISRPALVKALQAEGVHARAYRYPLQHTMAVYHEAKWWHHPPTIPDHLPGSEQANNTAVALPYFTTDVPELVDQYAEAFEKVWARRKDLA
jgi:dTDP-4-amino-4,6-dideoxygalactose transaminase